MRTPLQSAELENDGNPAPHEPSEDDEREPDEEREEELDGETDHESGEEDSAE